MPVTFVAVFISELYIRPSNMFRLYFCVVTDERRWTVVMNRYTMTDQALPMNAWSPLDPV